MFRFLDLKVEMFGVDIGDSAIKVLKLRKKHKFFDVEFLNEVEIEPGIIEAGVIKILPKYKNLILVFLIKLILLNKECF